MSGVEETLDPTYIFRFWVISKYRADARAPAGHHWLYLGVGPRRPVGPWSAAVLTDHSVDLAKEPPESESDASSGSLPRYIVIQRFLLVIPMLWILLTLVFFLLRVAPGDPVSAALGGRLSEEVARQQRRADLGLDKPILVQYLGLPQLGRSASTSAPPSPTTSRSLDVIRDNGGATLSLDHGRVLLRPAHRGPARPAGRPLRDTPLDVGIRIFGIITYAAPDLLRRHLLMQLVVSSLPAWPTSTSPAPTDRSSSSRATHPHPADRRIPERATRTSIIDVLQHLVLPCLSLGLLLIRVSSSG